MLYVLLVTGQMMMQDMSNINGWQTYCLAAAQELKSSPKVTDAFCTIEDPDDSSKIKIGRTLKDQEAKPDGEDHN